MGDWQNKFWKWFDKVMEEDPEKVRERFRRETSWLDGFREDTERIRLETEEIKKETERLREENRKLRALSPEKLEQIAKSCTRMKLTDRQILNLAHSHFEEVYHPPEKYGVYGVFEVSEQQVVCFARALDELAQENPQNPLDAL